MKKLVEVAKIVEEATEADPNQQPKEIKRTKAEMAFQKMKEKTVIIYCSSSNFLLI